MRYPGSATNRQSHCERASLVALLVIGFGGILADRLGGASQA
jgi:hypothetical protein